MISEQGIKQYLLTTSLEGLAQAEILKEPRSNDGTVRFLVEIRIWAKKRFQGILKSPENASRDHSPTKIGLNSP